MQFLPGFLTVVFITAVAGLVAYAGDRVGHQVGRRRLTLFGLRPKYTSTIVAVGTGMLIALLVTTVALVASDLVRTAFFQIGELNNQIHRLQAQADAAQNELLSTRNGQIVLVKRQPIYRNFLILDHTQTDSERLAALSKFFDEVVKSANATLTQSPTLLKRAPLTSSDPHITKLLKEQLADPKVHGPLVEGDNVLLLPVADQNLVRGDRIHFAFDIYQDKRLASANSTLASIDVAGGTPIDFNRLIAAAQRTAIDRGMPPYYTAYPLANNTQAEPIFRQVIRGRGRFHVVARSAQDLYPHSAALVLDFALSGGKS